ncbi:hypothetical protein LMG33818_001635 [Halomonadaceae bacterium LMG 33818]|uniref:capsule biosynthesis protein n=1 Tax=Cernens ardua TaxID=3402176 RepID=UPI003EDC339B
MNSQRSYLLLQGVCSPFFSVLADHLISCGHQVVKINFNVGDQLYWRTKAPSYNWRGKLEDLPDFVTNIWKQHGITDQILFGDCRPVHKGIIQKARASGIRNHVFEEGYLRPYWITLEQEGVNANSMLPRNSDWYLRAAEYVPRSSSPKHKIASAFNTRALHDVAYHLGGALNPVLFPHYKTHAALTAPQEYLGYLWRFARLRNCKRRDEEKIKKLLESGRRYFFIPLQLNGDFQVRQHSAFSDMNELMTYVSETFALHAPKDAILVFKNHPLDMGITPHAQDVEKIIKHYNLQDRILYLETGNLNQLIHHSEGMITLNSTCGHVSLAAKKPTIALANAIYSMPGLTHQGSLESFWYTPQAPDPKIVDAFRRVLTHTVQVNGGFYTPDGIELAVRNSVSLLEAEQSPLEQLLCQIPESLCALS